MSANVWPEVVPLSRVRHPEPVSLDLMPEPLADVVEHVSEVMQAPRDMAWGVALSVLSTAIGKRAKVALPTHDEASPIWTCTILPPGSRKSGVFSAAVEPLDEIEAALQGRWKEDRLAWLAEKEIAEANIRAIKDKLKNGKGDRKELRAKLQEEMRVLEEEPIKPHVYLTDTTPEALRQAIQSQGSVGLLSAEGSSILDSFGRYSGNRGADMALFLAAFSGDADKGARVSGTYGSREALASIGITAQPDVLQAIGGDPVARGRGLLDRFLFIVPEDPRGSRDYRKRLRLDPSVMNRWRDVIRRIHETGEEPQCVRLTPEAEESWIAFAQEIEDRQSPDGDLRYLSGPASKLAGIVGRIALAYHYAQGKDATSRIDGDTMWQAVGSGHKALEHIQAAWALMGEDEATVRARRVLEWIKRQGLEAVKAVQVYDNGVGGCANADEAHHILERLEKHGYLMRKETEKRAGRGRRPAPVWMVNPAVSEARPHPEKTEKIGQEGIYRFYRGRDEVEKRDFDHVENAGAELITDTCDREVRDDVAYF